MIDQAAILREVLETFPASAVALVVADESRPIYFALAVPEDVTEWKLSCEMAGGDYATWPAAPDRLDVYCCVGTSPMKPCGVDVPLVGTGEWAARVVASFANEGVAALIQLSESWAKAVSEL
jgi:hypothetical protein